MTMSELLKLGAPRLPDGLFYRIKPTGLGMLEFQIRQKRKYFGSSEVIYALTYREEGSILIGCQKVFENYTELMKCRKQANEIEKYFGDHK